MTSRTNERDRVVFETTAGGRRASVVVMPWGAPPDAAHRQLLLSAIAADSRWCLLCNGRVVRLIDGRRPWSRLHLEFDLGALPHDADARGLFLALLHASALAGADPILDRAVEQSARHGVSVCRALSDGVMDALAVILASLSRPRPARRGPEGALFDQSLTVLYRVLFLLFAEARSLVPVWDPVYRDRYTLDAIVTALTAGRACRGIWPALQAISRLAHAGCRAGALRVTAFNGRLFSPAYTAAIERARLDDATMAGALLAVTTIARKGAVRRRILYHDLDVEQLGMVYERVLDYEAAGPALRRTGDRRKATGAFYTPRSVTDWLVRKTLAPLVDNRTAQEVLALRILDPAMGSGAFLVSACRYIAGAAEAAHVACGDWAAGSVTDGDRARLRREVAQKCLYGADLNPMAVQLARLSLWLATLAREKPLTFLDHHLMSGDSLVGASPSDLRRQPPGAGRRTTRQPLPLFADDASFDVMVEHLLPARLKLALEPDDDVGVVRNKERLWTSLQRERARTAWKSVLDLWCALWFWGGAAPPDPALYGELHAALLHRQRSLPDRAMRPWLEGAARVAAERRFLHWALECPEVFFDEHGRRRPDGGFDAILGNPPWDMIRGDSGETAVRLARRHEAAQLAAFVRDAGVYTVSSRAHGNRYQLFVERALQLVRPGGRIGLVLPGGALSDAGAGPMRVHLFDRARVDTVTAIDNRRGIFPVHRGLRIALVTATAGTPTERMSCRLGVAAADDLESPTDQGRAPDLVLTRRLIERLSGEDDLGIPAMSTANDLRLLERVSASVPLLSAAEGWHVRFARELNATDDRGLFVAASGGDSERLVLEGKQIEPFRVDLGACRLALADGTDLGARVPRRARLVYRDVASATNRLTLIAAIVPARVATTHTLFVLRTPLPLGRQHALCALLNSFVSNYLIRMRVNTHVTTALMSRLPLPVPDADTERRLAHLAQALASADGPADRMPEYIELQSMAAMLYGLGAPEFEHVLSTFPLVDPDVRTRCLQRFSVPEVIVPR